MATWFNIDKLSPTIYRIDDNGNSLIYLILGKSKALLIDTGWGIHDLSDVVSSITDLPLLVVNTHGHPDHSSGAYQFSHTHIHRADLSIINGCFMVENRQWALDNPLKDKCPADFDSEKWKHLNVKSIIPVESGHKFDLGDRIVEVIHLPGHTPGGIALLDYNERILFSGDAILRGELWLNMDHSSPLSHFLSSLTLLMEAYSEDFDIILPGHGKPSSQDLIVDTIKALKSIISGKSCGKPYNNFVGYGLKADYENFSIIYRRSNI